MKTTSFLGKFIIVVLSLFIISQIVFVYIYSFPSQKSVISEPYSENDRDIEDIEIDKSEKRKGISASMVSITNDEEAKNLKKYSRISHLDIKNVDTSSLIDLKDLEVISLSLDNTKEFDMSEIKFRKLTSLIANNTRIKNLEVLHDSDNFFNLTLNGSYPENTDILKGLKKLTYLSLANIDLKTTTFLEDMTDLSYLDLSECGLTNIAAISKLNKLDTLILSNNHITEISPLSQLNNLSYLDISNNEIKGTLNLSNMPYIQNVYAKFNFINEIQLSNNISGFIDLSYNNIKEINDETFNILSDDIYTCNINLFGNILKHNNKLNNADCFSYVDENNVWLTYEQHQQYTNALNEFCKKYIKPEWSDIKKAAISYCALGNYVKYFYDYETSDKPEADYVHTEYGTLVNKIAVCDGFAYAYRDILRQIGIRSYIYIGDRYSTTDNARHAWNIIYIDSKPYHCDITLIAEYKSDLIYYDTEDYFTRYLGNFGLSDEEAIKNRYFLTDKKAPKCTENISKSAISNIVYEIVNGEELYFFVDKDEYKTKRAEYLSDMKEDKYNE